MSRGLAVAAARRALELKGERVMEQIRWTCPECGKKLSVTEDKAGKRGRCPGCGADIVVPEAEANLVAPADADDACETVSGTEGHSNPQMSAGGTATPKEGMPWPVLMARIVFLVVGALAVLGSFLMMAVTVLASSGEDQGIGYMLPVFVALGIGSVIPFLAARGLKRGSRVGATFLAVLWIASGVLNPNSMIAGFFAVLGVAVLVAVDTRRSAEWLRERRKEYRVRGGKT